MEFDIGSYYLTCVKDDVTEVYSAIHKQDSSLEYIFKYANDESQEIEILNYLQKLTDSVPNIHYTNVGANISPKGRSYNKFIVMSYIKGDVLSNRYDSNPYKIREKSVSTKKAVLTEIIKLIELLHQQGIIYGDVFPGNIIISDERVYLIDFGRSFYTNTVPDYFSEIIQKRPITSDIFCLQSLIYEAFPDHICLDNEITTLDDLMQVVNNK